MMPFLLLQMRTVSAFLDLPEHLVFLLAHFLPSIMNVCKECLPLEESTQRASLSQPVP